MPDHAKRRARLRSATLFDRGTLPYEQ